jgi:hypothetical protein
MILGMTVEDQSLDTQPSPRLLRCVHLNLNASWQDIGCLWQPFLLSTLMHGMSYACHPPIPFLIAPPKHTKPTAFFTSPSYTLGE